MSAAPAVSVILPVYDVEAYLPACLDSLLAQTFTDFEVLAVDDGSTDGSPAVLEAYEARFGGRMRRFSKANGGLADARNFGIEHARGTCLAFVDSDDLAEPAMLEKLHALVRERGADFAVCGMRSLGTALGQDDYYPEPDMSVFGASLRDEPRLLYRVDASACDKLLARRLFEDPPVRFPVGMDFEDLPTTYRLLARAERVEKVDEPLYLYRRDRTGAITAQYGLGYLDLVEGLRMLDGAYERDGLFSANRSGLLRLHLTHLLAGRFPDLLLNADAPARERFVGEAFALLDARFPGWRTDPVCRDVWRDGALRAIATHVPLLLALCRLPRRAYLGVLSRLGAFDPMR